MSRPPTSCSCAPKLLCPKGEASPVLVQVKNGQDLAVVGHEGLAYQVRAAHQLLQQLQRDAHHLQSEN